jgi:predicted  nucleic acid-binding Zn-ribbon protein
MTTSNGEILKEVDYLKDRTNKMEAQIENIEHLLADIDIKLAVANVNKEYTDKKFDAIETRISGLSKDIKSISDGIRAGFTRLMWLVGALILSAFWKFISAGGLTLG